MFGGRGKLQFTFLLSLDPVKLSAIIIEITLNIKDDVVEGLISRFTWGV
jgi:hypothetical protein